MTLTDNTVAFGLHLIANSVTSPAEKTMIARWEKEYHKYNFESARRKKILQAVHDGYDTRDEIAITTGIHISTIRRILLDLIRQKLIVSYFVKKGTRRPERRFYLAG